MNPIVRWTLTLITIAGLAVDVFVHWHVAWLYASRPSSSFITEYGLFKFEAVLALVVAVALLVRPNRLTAGAAALVAGGGAAALLAYYQWDIGKIGPIPDMSDHTWYPKPDKAWSVIAELVAFVTALVLVFFAPRKSKAGF